MKLEHNMIFASQLNDGINLKNFENDSLKIFSPVLLFLEKELSKIRTNRAHPSLIEDIKIISYGGAETTQLKNLALITTPDALTLLIQPFDTSIINDIEKGLSQSEIGLNPKNEGRFIKINLPPMSKERRIELSKIVSKKKEDAIVQARKTRQDILNEIKKAEKDKGLSQDFSQRLQKALQQCFDKINEQLDLISKKKEISLQE
jgi:ribosome recycling factor